MPGNRVSISTRMGQRSVIYLCGVEAIFLASFTIEGSSGRLITGDISIPKSKAPVPVLIFCHGFKGFKSWGFFDWFAREACKQGVAVVKFNFAWNGTTQANPNEITDFEAFGNNNYSKELDDLNRVITWLETCEYAPRMDLKQLALCGHSRGGSICLLQASGDKRVKSVITWAAPIEFDSFFRKETIEQWQKTGKVDVKNSRTGEVYPLYKQFYDDYQAHKNNLDIEKACIILDKPLLIIHGDADESVLVEHAERMYELVPHSIFIRVMGGTHTFGAAHPFNAETQVTTMLEELVENTVEFVKED